MIWQLRKERDARGMYGSIREWYAAAWPDDGMGGELNDGRTFKGLSDALRAQKDVYGYLGCGDSVIRERVFCELSERMGVDYKDIYALWLDAYG